MKLQLPNDVLVFLPENKASYPLVIIFGGMYYANPEWMAEQLKPSYFEKSILLIIPYTQSYKTILPNALKEIDRAGYKVNGKAIMGFSAGGNDVLQNYSDEFYFVGLIDPSLTQSGLNLPIDKRWGMMFNDKNWGSYPSIKALFQPYAEKINDQNGFALGTNLKHQDIPKEFFKEFESKILTGFSPIKNTTLYIVAPILLLVGAGLLIYYFKFKD